MHGPNKCTENTENISLVNIIIKLLKTNDKERNLKTDDKRNIYKDYSRFPVRNNVSEKITDHIPQSIVICYLMKRVQSGKCIVR
jgi:hypothetical protein